jgi:translation initiation factor SUI1
LEEFITVGKKAGDVKDENIFGRGFFNDNVIHLRVIQQGRRKTTIIQGLPPEYNLVKINKELKKKCHCSGTVANDLSYGNIIKLTGNQCDIVILVLLENNIVESRKNIYIHGV